MSDATSNRERMPTVAKMVDELREQGITVKVVYAKENGVQVGQPSPSMREIFEAMEKRCGL